MYLQTFLFFNMFWNISGFSIAGHLKEYHEYNIWALKDTNRGIFFIYIIDKNY